MRDDIQPGVTAEQAVERLPRENKTTRGHYTLRKARGFMAGRYPVFVRENRMVLRMNRDAQLVSAPIFIPQGEKSFPCCSCCTKKKPDAHKRRGSSASRLPFCSGIVGGDSIPIALRLTIHCALPAFSLSKHKKSGTCPDFLCMLPHIFLTTLDKMLFPILNAFYCSSPTKGLMCSVRMSSSSRSVYTISEVCHFQICIPDASA